MNYSHAAWTEEVELREDNRPALGGRRRRKRNRKRDRKGQTDIHWHAVRFLNKPL